MEKKIAVCIGTQRSGAVRVRLSLMLCEGDKVHSESFHSIAFLPGDDLSAGRAAVEAHIANPDGGVPFAPWPAIPDSEWAKAEGVCRIFQAGLQSAHEPNG